MATCCYATGIGIGGLYGLLIGNRGVSTPLTGAALGIVAMIASDLPIALTGASDPRTWTPVDWASDLIPHLVYGLVTAGTYEMLAAGAGWPLDGHSRAKIISGCVTSISIYSYRLMTNLTHIARVAPLPDRLPVATFSASPRANSLFRLLHCISPMPAQTEQTGHPMTSASSGVVP